MTRRLLPFAALLPLLAAACGGDDEPGDASPSVEITDAWARTTPPGTTVGAIYFVIESSTDDAIVSATVDDAVAGAVELHEMAPISDGTGPADANAMMGMEHVDRLELPAGEELDIDEAGYHVMVVDLATPLETGETFDLTLGFDQAPAQTITVEVSEYAPGDD